MKYFKQSILVIAFIGLPALVWAQKGTVVDKIVAKVDDYIILKSELEMAYAQMISQGQVKGDNAKCEVLESLIINKLMAAKAEIDSVIVEPDIIERELDMRMQMAIQQLGGEDKILKYYNKTVAEFREELKEQVAEQKTVEKMQMTITEEIKVTPAEVKRFYKQIPESELPYFSTEVTIGQIVKKPEVNKEEADKAYQFLASLKKDIESGKADFEDMARKHSEGPTNRNGGNLGWSKRGQMVPEFEAVAMKLKEGAISDPVKTEFGLHLIQLIERRGNEYNSRHILIQHKYKETDFAKAGHFLDSIKNLIETDTLKFESAAKEYSDDKESAGAGGYYIDAEGSNKIPVDQLDGNLYFTIDTMQVGSITAPMRFTMNDGKEAMRIIYYKSKVKPHQANLEDDYQKILQAAIQSKKSQKLNDWFIEAKEDVFILIDEEYNTCKILN